MVKIFEDNISYFEMGDNEQEDICGFGLDETCFEEILDFIKHSNNKKDIWVYFLDYAINDQRDHSDPKQDELENFQVFSILPEGDVDETGERVYVNEPIGQLSPDEVYIKTLNALYPDAANVNWWDEDTWPAPADK